MADDRPIKAHLDEEMRSHMEFCVRRHVFELETWIDRKRRAGQPTEDLEKSLALTNKCLRELNEAGT